MKPINLIQEIRAKLSLLEGMTTNAKRRESTLWFFDAFPREENGRWLRVLRVRSLAHGKEPSFVHQMFGQMEIEGTTEWPERLRDLIHISKTKFKLVLPADPKQGYVVSRGAFTFEAVVRDVREDYHPHNGLSVKITTFPPGPVKYESGI